MKTIPYGHQSINNRDINAVIKVLKSDWITQGSCVDLFEKKLAQYCGAKYAVVVSSGTAALHLACLAAGMKKGDEALTSPITFLATSNAVLYTGAKPVFVDVDEDTANIKIEAIKKNITGKTKAILPVHFAGLPCNMREIGAIAKKHRLMVIEDASHAVGAKYKVGGKLLKVGSCWHSDMCIFSFHPVKHITTGEGGAITTNNRQLYEKLKALRSHGVYQDEQVKKRGVWFYEMRDLGFNYRLTDLQCALGISQLTRINKFVSNRKKIAKEYCKAFKGVDGLQIPFEHKDYISSWHLFVLKIDFKKFNMTRNALMKKLKKKGVGTQVHYIPVYQQPYYRRLKLGNRNCPNAEKYYRECLSIPIFPEMSISDVRKVIKTIKQVLKLKSN